VSIISVLNLVEDHQAQQQREINNRRKEKLSGAQRVQLRANAKAAARNTDPIRSAPTK
jgi:hypothetical protein